VSDTNLAEEIVVSRESFRGDLTQGPILRTLVLFSIPALISNILQTIGGSINAIWVAQLLGKTAVAATANANMIMFLMFGTVFGFGMATTIKIGQHFGARDIDGARRNFGAGIGFCTGLATVIAILGWFFADSVLRIMATPAEAHEQALIYLRITFLAMPFLSLSMIVSTGLRGAGDATTPMASMILTVIIGIVLNPVLISGFGVIAGIGGSALAGAIASLTGAALMIATIYYRDLPLRLRGPELLYLIPRREELSFMVLKGLPMGAQTLLSSAAGLVMVGLVNREGMEAAAAYGASLQLWNYIQMPAFAIGTAVSSMVAQNVGASLHDRVDSINWAGIGTVTVVTGVLTALILLFDRPVLALFLGENSGETVDLGRRIQFICTWAFLLAGPMMVLFSTMRAYGAVMSPLIIMFVAMYPGRIGFYKLFYPSMGADALWWSYPAGSIIALILTVLFYRYGSWRKARPMAMPAVAG
jgi:putative MATE family efflux protein